MKRREKLKDVIELIELYQKRRDLKDSLVDARISNMIDVIYDLKVNIKDCTDKINNFLDEELDDVEEYNVSLTKVELANIINILCSHIYSHEENQVQDIIQIKDKLKEVLENKNEQIKQ